MIRVNEAMGKKSVLENIRKLKGKGLLRRVGPDKGGHWGIIEGKQYS